MELRKISNLSELAAEKARLQRQIDKREKRVGKAFTGAKEHLRHKMSVVVLIKNAFGKIFSLSSFLSHPATYFKVGTAIGKRLFTKRLK